MVRNPWSSYQKVAMQTASPGQLVLMLLEGALRFLDRAEAGFELDDPADRNATIHNNVQRTIDIVHELNMALDMTQGAALAATLRSLYAYFERRLVEADVRKEPSPLREVRQRLLVLRDAWAQMLQNPGAESATPPAADAMAAA